MILPNDITLKWPIIYEETKKIGPKGEATYVLY